MSMMYARLSEHNIMIAADTRVASTMPDGRTYVMPEECDKLLVIGNSVIFKTGNVNVVNAVLNELLTPVYSNIVDLSDKHISAICRKWHNIYIENCRLKNIKPTKSDEGYITSCGLVIAKYNSELGKMTITYFMPHTDFEPQHVESRNGMVGSLYAGVWDMWEPNAQDWVNKNEPLYNDKIELIRALYNHCNNEFVGGHLQIYNITRDNVNMVLCEEIPDKNAYLMADNTIYLNDNVVIRWKSSLESDISDALDEAGSASSVASSAKSTATTANNNVAKLANGQYTSGTFISGTEIASPTISGGTIVGGDYYDTEKVGKLNLANRTNTCADLIYTRVQDKHELFKIYDNADSTVSLYLYGHNIGWGASNTFYPSGTWNFNNATVKNLNVTFG